MLTWAGNGWTFLATSNLYRTQRHTDRVRETEREREREREREMERQSQKERGRQTVTGVVFYRNVSAVITNQIKFLIY
jgi:hypothetical protein